MQTIKIEHKNKTDIIFEHTCIKNNLKITIEAAIAAGTSLESANLRGANLWGTSLESANLRGANLVGANLVGANLVGANLESANLRGANLESANLWGTNLESANLESANLRGTVGIVTFGPIGVENRLVYLYINKNIQCRIGCFSGNLTEATNAIISKYGQNSTYELMLKAAAWSLASKNYV